MAKEKAPANTTCASGEQKLPCVEVDGEDAWGESGTVATSPSELGLVPCERSLRLGRNLRLVACRTWPMLRLPCRLWATKCPDMVVAARGLELMVGFAFMTQSAGVPHVAISHLRAAFAR